MYCHLIPLLCSYFVFFYGKKYALWKSGAYISCIRFYFKNLFQCWGNPYPSSPNVFVDALYDSISPQWHAAHHQPVLMKQLICEPQITADELLLALLHAICAKRSIQKRCLLDNSHLLHIYDMLNNQCKTFFAMFLNLNQHCLFEMKKCSWHGDAS